MAAQSLQVFTLDIPNPEWNTDGTATDPHRINGSISFNYLQTSDIRTISTNGASAGMDIMGLLYVPDLDSNDTCIHDSAPYVPTNVTRQANLPEQDYQLIAIAPWTSPDCALHYMQAARQDPCRAFFFYIPDNSSLPPSDKDPVWDISSGGNWKQDNGFPVYAISGEYGQLLVLESSFYSGNMTEVPNGHDLSETYDSRDYVRLYVDIDTGANSTSLPSLWVFLLVVLGILLTIIGLTSLSMHWIQRRRRQALRRRVASGEVDLEALGIKRLTVPQELLNQMPLYTYGTGQPIAQDAHSDNSVTEEKTGTARPIPALLHGDSFRPSTLSQPTCPICLDDFVPAEAGTEGTTVRELPCHHIFHPECVDTFLRDSSSLCPMCKKTALPKGYCPKIITNAMVRRERMVRQIRERIDPEATEGTGRVSQAAAFRNLLRSRTQSGFSHFRPGGRTSNIRTHDGQPMQQLNTVSLPPPGTADTTTPLAPPNSSPWRSRVQPPSNPRRQEWARQRAVDMLGQRAPADPDAEEAQRTPAWRKAMRGLFPRR